VGVVDSGDEEACALGGVVEVSGIEEEEALLPGVGFDGVGGKGCMVELVAVFLRESAVSFILAGKRDGEFVLGTSSRGTDGGEYTLQVVERVRVGFGAVSGDKLEASVA